MTSARSYAVLLPFVVCACSPGERLEPGFESGSSESSGHAHEPDEVGEGSGALDSSGAVGLDEGETSSPGSSDGARGETTMATEGTGMASESTGDPRSDGGSSSGGRPEGPGCGNGITEEAEVCDDGNVEDGDACSSDCTEAQCLVPITHMAIQEAIDDASCPVVWVEPGVYAESLEISQDVEVRALFADTVTVDAGGVDRTIDISGGSVVLRDLLVTGGDTTSLIISRSGGGIRVEDADLTMQHCTVTGNIADASGGGIYVREGSATLLDSMVSFNTARSSGGGVAASAATLLVDGGGIIGNAVATDDSSANGGGIEVRSGSNVTVTGGTMVAMNECVAETFRWGGGIRVWNSTLELSDGATVMANTASFGAAIRATGDSVVTIADATIDGNIGNEAIRAGGATFEIDRSSISDNSARALDAGNGTIEIRDSTIAGNVPPDGHGGAFQLSGVGTTRIERCLVEGNVGDLGGAVSASNGAVFVAVNSTFDSNEAQSGAVLHASGGGDASFHNCTLTGNAAEGQFGLMIGFSGIVAMANTIVADNDVDAEEACGLAASTAFTSGGHNLIEDCVCASSMAWADSDICTGEPQLESLADNGGPTLTRAITQSSPARNAGPPTGCTDDQGSALLVDQRGESRLVDAPCDIGAFEFIPE